MTANQIILTKLKVALSKVNDDIHEQMDIGQEVTALLERAYPTHENIYRIRFRALYSSIIYYSIEKDTTHGKPSDFAESMKKILTAVIEDLEIFENVAKSAHQSVQQPINITNNISQHQSQNQTQSLSVIHDILKQSLSREQIEELNSINTTESNPEEKKSKFIEKIKSFGGDIASNILASILTNPDIWAGVIG